jgi:tetratricopeptide (TPR) repeat protein
MTKPFENRILLVTLLSTFAAFQPLKSLGNPTEGVLSCTNLSLPELPRVDILGDAVKALTNRIERQRTPQNLLERARAYFLEGRFPAAIKDLSDALTMQPKLKEALTLRAYCYLRTQDYPAARADFSTLSKLEPSSAIYHCAIAYCLHREDKTTEAIEEVNKAIAIEPKNAYFYQLKVAMYGSGNDLQNTLKTIQQGLEASPNDENLLFSRAYAAEIMQKDDRAALKELDQLIALHPDFDKAYEERAAIEERKGEWQKAKTDYDTLIDFAQKDNASSMDKAINLAQQKDLIGGVFLIAGAMPSLRQKSFYLGRRAEAYRNLRDFDKAHEDSLMETLLSPKNPEAYYELAMIDYDMDDLKGSNHALDTVLLLNPKHTGALFLHGYVLTAFGDYGQAAKSFSSVYQIGDDEEATRYAYIYALSAKLLGKADIAADLEEAAKHEDLEKWPGIFVAYLQKKIDRQKFEAAAANDKNKTTEMHCFLGLKDLADGKKTEALEHFKWVVDNGEKSFLEFPLSRYFVENIKN